MFYNCTGLITPPTIGSNLQYVYEGGCNQMFMGCTNMTNFGELSATEVGKDGYRCMFSNCSKLSTGPTVLPATTISGSAYYEMFSGCTSLLTQPIICATTLNGADGYNCTRMFNGCSSMTTTQEILSPMTLRTYCYNAMYENCSGITSAPILPATTLVQNVCYGGMFRNCKKINYIKAMFTTTPGTNYTLGWLYGVSNSGTFVKNSAATWDVSGANGIPTNWTVETASS